MSELIILCHLEHLAPYDLTDKHAYSLNISVASSDSAMDINENAKLVLRPWLAKQITNVSVFIKESTPPIIAEVPVLQQVWHNTPITFDAPKFVKRDQIVAELQKEFDKCNAECLTWKLPAKDDPPVTENAHKPWHTFIGQAAQLPTPIPQLLNLSLIFYLANPSNKPIVAAPILDFPAPASFKLSPRTDLTELPPLAGKETVKIWEYAAQTGLPAIKAYAEECLLRTASSSGAFLDLQTLWVKNPKDTANPDGFSNFSEDWRAMLENRMADAFDLSQRIVEYLKEVPATFNTADFLLKIRRMFLVALRDISGIGINRGPDNQVLLEFLTGKDFKPHYEKIRDAVASEAVFGDAGVPNQELGVDKWARFILQTFPTLSKVNALTNPSAITSIQDAVSELELLHQTVLSDEGLASLVKAQWRKISELSTLTEPARIALQEAYASPKLTQINLRRALAQENLGVFWRHFTKSGLADSNGKPKVKENFSCYFRAYFLLRFDQDLSALGNECPNLVTLRDEYVSMKVSPPFRLDSNDSVLGELTNTIKRWSERNFGDRLVPEPLKNDVQQGVTEEFTEVPHAVTIMVDKLDGDVDTTDLLSSIAGVGILMREEGTPKWQCLNMADSRLRKEGGGILELGEQLFDQPVLVPSRLNYINDLRQSFVTYNNHPLAAKSPAAMLAKRNTTSNQEPLTSAHPQLEETWESLVSYFYAKPQTFEDARIPALKFGKRYQVLPFIIGNSGIVPKELAKITPATGAPTSSPGEIDLSNFTSGTLTTEIRKFAYYRKVRIGHIRVFSVNNAAGQTVEGTCLNLPPIPETVYPRLRDLKIGDANTIATNTNRERPLLLLSPFEAPGAVSNFDFYVQLPSIDINTWDRWVASGKIYNKPITGPVLKELRTSVWSEHYKRIKVNPDSDNCQVVPAASNPAIDEPALELKFFAELERFNDDGSWTPASQGKEIPVEEGTDPQPLARVQSKPIPVTCNVATTASEVFDFLNGKLQVSLIKGRMYRLTISCCLPKEDYPQAGPTPVPRFGRIYSGNLPSPTGKTYYKVSPLEIYIEVATDEIVPGIIDPDLAKQTLHEWLSSGFERLPKEPPVGPKSDAVEVKFKKTVSGQLREQVFSFVHRVELKRQMWRWQGRDTKPHPIIRRASTPLQTEIDRWEVKEYGNRFDDDHVIINMDSKVNDDPSIDPATASGKRIFSYVEYLTGEKSKKEELRALHYRFRATAYSRYAGILPAKKASISTDIWKSQFVPCRVKELIDPPKVKLIFPLTQSFGASTTPNRSDDTGTSGLLAVFDESWHEIAGIGEGLGIEVAQVRDPDVVPGSAPESERFYFEIGLDPIVSGQALRPSAVSFLEEQKRGPVGHTFDRSDDQPFFTATSFVVPAPLAADASTRTRFGAWGMCKIRFRRVVLLGTILENGRQKEIRLESKFTDPFWVQYLPDFSVFREIIDGRESEIKNFIDLRVEVLGDKKIRLFKKENPRVSVVLKPSNVGDKNIFERYLILTREVFDATGQADQEVYLGVMSPNPQSAGEWQTSDCLDLSGSNATTKLRARIIEVQRRNNGRPPFRTADELWKRLFDLSVSDYERCRIVRISEPIYSEAAVKKLCE
jgi:hypothetical protein